MFFTLLREFFAPNLTKIYAFVPLKRGAWGVTKFPHFLKRSSSKRKQLTYIHLKKKIMREVERKIPRPERQQPIRLPEPLPDLPLLRGYFFFLMDIEVAVSKNTSLQTRICPFNTLLPHERSEYLRMGRQQVLPFCCSPMEVSTYAQGYTH